ncbi:tripartite tricarboxylate transporter TctB family protein [Devosia sp. A369]
MTTRLQNIGAGILFILAGLYFSLESWHSLDIGTASFMGPGYFPIWLGGILTALGLIRLVTGLRGPWVSLGDFPVRGIVLIGIAPIIFGMTLEGLGFIGSLFLATFIAALSSTKVGIGLATLTAAGVTLLCIVVFHFGIRLSIPLIGHWII